MTAANTGANPGSGFGSYGQTGPQGSLGRLGPLERGVSTTTGLLLLATLPRLSLRHLLMASAAGYCVYRGILGACPLRQRLLARQGHGSQLGHGGQQQHGVGAAEFEALMHPIDQGTHAGNLARASAVDMAVVDEASRESFPASDVPAFNQPTAAPAG